MYSVKTTFYSASGAKLFSRRFSASKLNFESFFPLSVQNDYQISYFDEFGDKCFVDSTPELTEAFRVLSREQLYAFHLYPRAEGSQQQQQRSNKRVKIDPNALRSVRLRSVNSRVNRVHSGNSPAKIKARDLQRVVLKRVEAHACADTREITAADLARVALKPIGRGLPLAGVALRPFAAPAPPPPPCKRRARITPRDLLAVQLKPPASSCRQKITPRDLQRVNLRPVPPPQPSSSSPAKRSAQGDLLLALKERRVVLKPPAAAAEAEEPNKITEFEKNLQALAQLGFRDRMLCIRKLVETKNQLIPCVEALLQC